MKRYAVLLTCIAALLAGCNLPTYVKAGAPVPPMQIQKPSSKFDQPPRLIEGSAPEYPQVDELQRYAKVAFTISTNGTTTEIRVVHTDDEKFATAVVAAIEAWRFEPATKEGSPVPLRVRQEIRQGPKFHPKPEPDFKFNYPTTRPPKDHDK